MNKTINNTKLGNFLQDLVLLSEHNTFSKTLPSGGGVTGGGELNEYPDVMITASSSGAAELYVEFSIDNEVTWSVLGPFVLDPSRINAPHILVKGYRHFRVRVVDTSGSNNTINVSTVYGSFQKLTASLNATLSENYDATVVRPTDYNSEVAMGKRQGRNVVHKWGRNINFGTSEELLSSFGGAFTPANIITTAQTLTITYNNTTDGLGTTGALAILITHLDEDFKEQQVIHVLGNTGSDVTSFTTLGVNRAVVVSFGGIGWNVNSITMTATTLGTIQAQIPALASVTQQAIFHTQINNNLMLDWLFLSALKSSGGGSPKVTFKIYSWSRVTLGRYLVFDYELDTSIKDSLELTPPQKFVFGGREVIYVTVQSSATSTNARTRFAGIQERIS